MSGSHSSTPSRLSSAPKTPELAAKIKALRRFAKRRHAETRCAPVGFQPGKEKIFQHDDPSQLVLSQWRNNLTALSQRYNLYIVAGGARLWAYTPRYPHQALSKHPQLILQPRQHSPDRPGHIDRENPHSVNNLTISDLGDQEILVCACDDGDVYAYHTQAIYNAIQRREQQDSEESLVAEHIHPFFHKNVDRSAWGLAVHKTARLIAVSCNAHLVHVFAFALSTVKHGQEDETQDPGELENSGSGVSSTSVECDDDGWQINPPQGALELRKDNLIVTLQGHGHNIPALAFCNTGDDPEGVFLMSTDIEGTLIIWNIVLGAPARVRPASSGRPGESGWGLHWLDKRAFRSSTALEAFTDRARFGTFRVGRCEFGVVDLSLAGRVHASTKPWLLDSSADRQGDEARDSDAEEESLFGGPQMDDDPMFSLEDVDDDLDGVRLPQTSRQSSRPMRFSRPRELASGLQDYTGCDSFGWDFQWPEPARVLQNPTWPHPRQPPAVPLLLFNADSLELYQTSCVEHTTRAQPYMTMFDPLAQEVPRDWLFVMLHMDRMNMSIQIPELGLVLAGSPKGRVAVFSLHQCAPNPFADDSDTPVFTVRLDVILPLSSDEADGKRPAQPLVGIAASPVQGYRVGRTHSRRADSAVDVGTVEALRRWRVMLLYKDHTLLSYELWRERESKDGTSGRRSGIGIARDDVPLV